MKPYVNIICIIDKSGSMQSIVDEAINGFNMFLKEQQEAEYKSKLSLLLFDTSFDKIYKNVKIKNVQPLNRNTYKPDSFTALYDSIGKECDEYLDFLAEIPSEERPTKTLFVILTDGFENASRQYHRDLIKRIVTEMREELNCEFIFLGANADACFQAESMGMSGNNAFSYSATNDGINVAYCAISKAVNTYATTDIKDNLFQEEQK